MQPRTKTVKAYQTRQVYQRLQERPHPHTAHPCDARGQWGGPFPGTLSRRSCPFHCSSICCPEDLLRRPREGHSKWARGCQWVVMRDSNLSPLEVSEAGLPPQDQRCGSGTSRTSMDNGNTVDMALVSRDLAPVALS